MNQIFLETRMFRLSDGEEIMTLAFFVLIQYRRVTDGRTDGHLCSGYTSACIACYANALVKRMDRCCPYRPVTRQESSAKLTNQRVSYAFTSSPFSFHARHILSKFQHSHSRIFTARCTMHSAKRGLAIACRLSVCLSVRLSVCDVGDL